MRIPVYTTRIRPAQEAPGRSIRAQKSVQQAVAFEEAKAAPALAFAEAVGEYAKTRYKIEVETKRNEAIAGAKEELMDLQRKLESSPRIFDVFKEDGTGVWDTSVASIKDRLRDTIGGNVYALQDFDSAFNQAEMTLRFSLKDAIETKVEARRKAALQQRNDQIVATYSNPYGNFTGEDLVFAEAELNSMWENAVKNGGVNPDFVSALGAKNTLTIAENVTMGYAGRDPNLVFGLAETLNILDKLQTGEIDEETAQLELEQIDLPNSSWAITTLSSIPRAKANEILSNTLTDANKFAKAKREEEAARVVEVKASGDKLKLFAFSDRMDSSERIPINEIFDEYFHVPGIAQSFLPGLSVGVYEELKAQGKFKTITDADGNEIETISPKDARVIIAEILQKQGILTLTEQDRLEDIIEAEEEGRSYAPTVSNELAKLNLTRLMANNQLTEKDVQQEISQLTAEDYSSFMTTARNIAGAKQTELDQELADELAILKNELFVVDRDVLNPEDIIANQTFASINAALSKEVNRGDIKTVVDLRRRSDELLNQERQKYKIRLRQPYLNTLKVNLTGPFYGAIDISSNTPLDDLTARWDAIKADPNNAPNLYYLEQDYLKIYADIERYVRRGIFQ